MYSDARSFIDRLGGYRVVAQRLKVSPTTVHTHLTNGLLPSRWYAAMIELANELGVEPPSRILFSFIKLPPLLDRSAA